MKAKTILLMLLVLGCGSPVIVGQDTQPATPERAVVIKFARELMQNVRFCTLITIGEDGQPQARIVDPFAPDDDMTVWIGTNPVTRKVAQVRKDPRVTLLYFDAAGPGYVTLLGTAELVDDAVEKAKRWKEEWAGHYKDKNSGDDYTLMRVKPKSLEIVRYDQGLFNDPTTWRPVIIEF